MSLKLSARDSMAEREDSDGDSSICWRRERDRNCLRVEVRPDEVFIFPYQQFVWAYHVHATAGDTLKITLATHEVIVVGLRLGKLVAALQELAVDWIRPLPSRYRQLGKTSDSLITSVEVKTLGG